ncbi:EamA/RhaT family transporter [Sphingobacterium sp. lm-10]|uniref:EamA/RhaT family transporter n=1 Tax=Sphingobacterium sp. lm-10 TaxID=2944904 RepID=UPI00202283A8|nr:EamA/RhaT family transporter [Sphingobacterium sp. lm-10]MCL7987773.1 EamA/RhaT family transporter [Sphingobacterium sp. lm-10]
MHFVLISVLCSVSVAVLLKYARRKGLDTWQMIVWNYPVAVCLTYFIFQPDFSAIPMLSLPWHLYIPVAVLLPALFMVLSHSLRYAGLVQTEVAQRLSLVLSLIAAAWLFHEVFSAVRIAGIIIGLMAVACLIGWRRSQQQVNQSRYILFPLVVFVGYGAIDILFKMVALQPVIPYTTSMFLMFSGAMLLALGYLAYQLSRKKLVLSGKAMGWGFALGFLNFGNILFYMKAHQALSDSPSVVFTGMNIGVIGLGALLGVWLFKEKLSTMNIIGIALAVVSVLMIAYL